MDKIGEVIGPKGKVINAMQQETGADIAVDDDGMVGTVTIGSADGAAVAEARRRIELILDPPKAEVGADLHGQGRQHHQVRCVRQHPPGPRRPGAHLQARRRQAHRPGRGRARPRRRDRGAGRRHRPAGQGQPLPGRRRRRRRAAAAAARRASAAVGRGAVRRLRRRRPRATVEAGTDVVASRTRSTPRPARIRRPRSRRPSSGVGGDRGRRRRRQSRTAPRRGGRRAGVSDEGSPAGACARPTH